jgi:hypothetical protein
MRRSKDIKAAKAASQNILGNYLQRQVVAQRLQSHRVTLTDKGLISTSKRVEEAIRRSLSLLVLNNLKLWFAFQVLKILCVWDSHHQFAGATMWEIRPWEKISDEVLFAGLFLSPDSIDLSGDSIEKTNVKMVSESKSVANTDVQTGQALQLTIVLIYMKNNTRRKMIKKLNARMDGGDLLTLKKAKTAGICIDF